MRHHQDGNEDRQQRHVIETMVNPICRAPFNAAIRGSRPLDEARDVLCDHNGVVNHKTGCDGQRHQRQVVEAVAEQYMAAKVPTSESGTTTLDQSRAQVAQKREDHQHDENT